MRTQTIDVELIKQKYRRNAAFYDPVTRAYARLRSRAVAHLRLRGGETVLDFACGTGLSFPPLEAGIGAGGRIVGVELSPDMLARAREKIALHGWRNVTLIEANAEAIELEPLSMDAVLAFYAYDVMLSARAVERAVQALRPGGRFVSAGPKLVPGPRGWAVNLLTRTIARAAAGQPLVARPWQQLEASLGPLVVEEHWGGAAYVANGIRPAQGT